MLVHPCNRKGKVTLLKDKSQIPKAEIYPDYQEVMEKHTLAPNNNSVLQSQMGDIQNTLNKVKHREDIES